MQPLLKSVTLKMNVPDTCTIYNLWGSGGSLKHFFYLIPYETLKMKSTALKLGAHENKIKLRLCFSCRGGSEIFRSKKNGLWVGDLYFSIYCA